MPKLVIVEGLDGSGKSTQVECLCRRLSQSNLPYQKIKLPDYESESSALVRQYLSGAFGSRPEDVNAYAASLLYAVDRFASYRTKWREAYQDGTLILADRYVTSNVIYQMAKLPREQWDAFLKWESDLEYGKVGIPRPDLVLYLDMPVEVSQTLLTRRYHGDESEKDVHEADVAYLRRCRDAALYAAARQGWCVVACAEEGVPLPVEAVSRRIAAVCMEELELTC